MDLRKIIESSITDILAKDHEEPNGVLRGSNTPTFYEGNFIATEYSHCPRVAILRSKYGIKEKRQKKSLISNEVGRSVEDKFKDWLKNSNYKIEYKEEEDALIELKDGEGKTIFTARPDFVFNHYGTQYVAELKSIQSPNTYLNIVKRLKPKDGAVVQLANYHAFHNVERGFLIYINMVWVEAYDFKEKKKVKGEPDFFLFDSLWARDTLYINRIKTVLSRSVIENSIGYTAQFLKEDKLPPIPHPITVFGEAAPYTACDYCPFNPTCKKATSLGLETFQEFLEFKKEIDYEL